MTTYIQRRGQGYLETVDEFDTWKDAREEAMKSWHAVTFKIEGSMT